MTQSLSSVVVLLFLASVAVVRGDNSNAVARGKPWVDAKVPYCQAANGAHDVDSSCASTCNRPHVAAWDKYRSDCSGFVSYAWGLPPPGRTTGDFSSVSSTIQCSALQPGDACVRPGHHIILFVSWNTQGSNANFYEEPGCSGSVTYAHAFSSAVSCSGSSVSVKGQSYTAIRYSGSVPGTDGSSSPSSPTPSAGGTTKAGSATKSGGAKPTSAPTNDAKCTAMGGVCQSTSKACASAYLVGYCSGGVTNRCCPPSKATSKAATTKATTKPTTTKATVKATNATTTTATTTSTGTTTSTAAATSTSTPASTSTTMASTTSTGASSTSSTSAASETTSAAPDTTSTTGTESAASSSTTEASDIDNNNWNSNGNAPSPMTAPESPAPDTPAPETQGYNSNSNGLDFANDQSSSDSSSNPEPSPSPSPASDYLDVVWAPAVPTQAPTWATYGNCTDVPGVCQQIQHPCALSYLSFQCKGGVGVSNVRCCPNKQLVDIGLDGQWKLIPGLVATETCTGLKFPLAAGSLAFISVNWGGARDGGGRCHSGVDLFTHNARNVVAMADGVVTNVITDFITCGNSGASVLAGAVMVYHPAIDQTVNYGEITSSTISVKKGATIAQGQLLGQASACGLLHIELYNGSVSAPLRWNVAKGKKAYDPDGCTHNSMTTKPPRLLDPRPLINCLKPTSASLLQDAGVGGELGVLPSTTHSKLSGGVIAAIVIVGVVVLVAIAVCVLCLVRRQQRVHELVVANAFFDPSAVAMAPLSSVGAVQPISSTVVTSSSSGDNNSSKTTYAPYASASPYNSTGNVSYATMADGGSTMLRRPGGAFGVASANTAGTGAASAHVEQVGVFTCATCGKVYQYETDLATHTQLRHP